LSLKLYVSFNPHILIIYVNRYYIMYYRLGKRWAAAIVNSSISRKVKVDQAQRSVTIISSNNTEGQEGTGALRRNHTQALTRERAN